MQLEFVNEINTETKIDKLLKGVSPYKGLAQSTPNEKWGKKKSKGAFYHYTFLQFSFTDSLFLL